MKQIEKRIKNESGDILIRPTDNCGIVEIVQLYSENKSGCVIGYWEKRKCDDRFIAEFQSCQDRIMTTTYDNADILLQALIFGQKLADLLVEEN